MQAGEDLARLLLLLIAAAAFVNVTRGTFRAWLRAKFVGIPSAHVAPSAPASPIAPTGAHGTESPGLTR